MDSELGHTAQTILIAEDEALVLKMLTYRLQKEGYKVLTATDGRQALACLRTAIPDLIITDLMMPYHNGLEIVEYVRNFMSARIPVIILSASGQESIMQKALSLGANDYAGKPFNPSDLVGLIKKYLG